MLHTSPEDHQWWRLQKSKLLTFVQFNIRGQTYSQWNYTFWTIHWMFDRGLISIDDDYSLLLASNRLPDTIEQLLNGNRKLLLPRRPYRYPHGKFLQYHRREIFKG